MMVPTTFPTGLPSRTDRWPPNAPRNASYPPPVAPDTPPTPPAAGLDRRRVSLAVVMGMVIVLAVVTMLVSASGPPEPGHPGVGSGAFARSAPANAHERGVIDAAEPAPDVGSLVFPRMAPAAARALNAAVAFAPLGQDRPLPFRLPVDDSGYGRALDCLASTVLHEAGDDRQGQAAVAQVVLNRMRHPAFPHSVCGVVFQGAERTTGCQFTFTCDGALRRRRSPAAWDRARATAAAFLDGETFAPVGMATHYHTDWVHPYWSATLDKIARVDTHLFFRWRGAWGRSAVFTAQYDGKEAAQPQLAGLSAWHRNTAQLSLTIDADPRITTDARAIPVRHVATTALLSAHDGEHFIFVDGGTNGSVLAMEALATCSGQTYCKVVGWDRRSGKFGSPDAPAIGTVAFLYVTDKRTGVEIVLWDCIRYNRPVDGQCLTDSNRRWISFRGNLSRAS